MSKKIAWSNVFTISILVFHLGCVLPLFFGVSPVAIVVCVLAYIAKGMGITAGFHRYFAHRAYKTSRFFQFMLALGGTMAIQGSVFWWTAHHRNHHKYTDTPSDIHTPIHYGFFWSHFGWVLGKDCFKVNQITIKDLMVFPELRWLHRFYGLTILLQGAFFFGLGALLNFIDPQLQTNGMQMLTWGFFISTVLLWHATFMVNSVCHLWGTRPFATNDRSRNNLLVALLTFGEGWHNNHHRYPYSERQGIRWYQIDITHYCLKTLSWTGLVWQLNTPQQRGLLE